MKVVILAGGLGTRLAEETDVRPKPMVEIGGKPILWHIMKVFAQHGLNEFIVALGYKGEVIKRFFYEYGSFNGDMSVNLAERRIDVSNGAPRENWTIHLVDTGDASMTGGRVKRLQGRLQDAPFIVTYGDGIADIDVTALASFHRSHDKIATVTAVHPPARYGELLISDDYMTEFREKPQTHDGWINGGFLVFEPKVLDYLSGDDSILEIDGLEQLANQGQLKAYKHHGYWQCMDTLRDKRRLQAAWESNNAKWKTW